MLFIEDKKIKSENKLVGFYLSYPVIENKSSFISKINDIIYKDIENFKELVTGTLNKPIIKSFDYKINALSEYKVNLNKNQIISISIDFSQLIGLYDITYVNSYNYDIDLNREIKLKDLFKKDEDYIDLINYFILKDIDEYLYDRFKGICDDNTFYITKEYLVLCFSSYELDKNYSVALEFKIPIYEIKNYLSDYMINNILE